MFNSYKGTLLYLSFPSNQRLSSYPYMMCLLHLYVRAGEKTEEAERKNRMMMMWCLWTHTTKSLHNTILWHCFENRNISRHKSMLYHIIDEKFTLLPDQNLHLTIKSTSNSQNLSAILISQMNAWNLRNARKLSNVVLANNILKRVV